MKVALLHDHLYQAGGAERVLYALAQTFPGAPIYTVIYNKKQIKGFEDFDIRTSFIQKLPFGTSRFKWYLPLIPTAIEELDLTEFDVVISSASALIKGVVTQPKTLHICYCHTPTRYLWSDTHQYRQDLQANRAIKKFLPFMLSKLRAWDQVASQRVDKYIANSHFVAQRIKRYYQKEAKVIYPPIDTHNFSISDAPKNYYFLVSRLRPYKRVDLAIQAFNKLGIPLKIAGVGEEEERLKKMANSNIEFLGAVSEQEKRKLLSECIAFIHPQEEDFGITPVEAMASGRPVIAYKSGGVLESVVESITGSLFPDQTWESLVDTVIKFDHTKFNPHTIKQHADQFGTAHFQEHIRNFVEQSYEDYKKSIVSLI